MATTDPASTQSTDAKPQPAGAEPVKGKKHDPGFRADGTAYPGVDPDTGERKAVTWDGLRAEFGERRGSRLYNELAVAAFAGVQPGRPDLSLATLDEKRFRPPLKNSQGDRVESEEDYEQARVKFRGRIERAKRILADVETEAAKENN
jgi:hypothetical protein